VVGTARSWMGTVAVVRSSPIEKEARCSTVASPDKIKPQQSSGAEWGGGAPLLYLVRPKTLAVGARPCRA
jgi:hypothetical protein